MLIGFNLPLSGVLCITEKLNSLSPRWVKTRIRPFRAMSASTSYGHAAPGILGGARHPSLPVAARWSRPRSRRQKNTWRLTVSPRTQSPSKCPTVYGGGEPLRAADDQWCSEARSVHRVA